MNQRRVNTANRQALGRLTGWEGLTVGGPKVANRHPLKRHMSVTSAEWMPKSLLIFLLLD